MSKFIGSIGIAALAVLAITATSNAAFAQAGSTGGTIGKTDKSVSGGEDTGLQRQPQREAPPRHPATSDRSAGNSCQKIVGTWAWQYPYAPSDVVFDADGSGHNPVVTAKWTCDGAGAIIRWSHGTVDHVAISGDGNTLSVSARGCGSYRPPLCSIGMSYIATRK
jgi:hypothetical protein